MTLHRKGVLPFLVLFWVQCFQSNLLSFAGEATPESSKEVEFSGWKPMGEPEALTTSQFAKKYSNPKDQNETDLEISETRKSYLLVYPPRPTNVREQNQPPPVINKPGNIEQVPVRNFGPPVRASPTQSRYHRMMSFGASEGSNRRIPAVFQRPKFPPVANPPPLPPHALKQKKLPNFKSESTSQHQVQIQLLDGYLVPPAGGNGVSAVHAKEKGPQLQTIPLTLNNVPEIRLLLPNDVHEQLTNIQKTAPQQNHLTKPYPEHQGPIRQVINDKPNQHRQEYHNLEGKIPNPSFESHRYSSNEAPKNLPFNNNNNYDNSFKEPQDSSFRPQNYEQSHNVEQHRPVNTYSQPDPNGYPNTITFPDQNIQTEYNQGQDNNHQNIQANYNPEQNNNHNIKPNYNPGQNNDHQNIKPNYIPGQNNDHQIIKPNYNQGQNNNHQNVPTNYNQGQNNNHQNVPTNYNQGQNNNPQNIPPNYNQGQNQNIPLNYNQGQNKNHQNFQPHIQGQNNNNNINQNVQSNNYIKEISQSFEAQNGYQISQHLDARAPVNQVKVQSFSNVQGNRHAYNTGGQRQNEGQVFTQKSNQPGVFPSYPGQVQRGYRGDSFRPLSNGNYNNNQNTNQGHTKTTDGGQQILSNNNNGYNNARNQNLGQNSWRAPQQNPGKTNYNRISPDQQNFYDINNNQNVNTRGTTKTNYQNPNLRQTGQGNSNQNAGSTTDRHITSVPDVLDQQKIIETDILPSTQTDSGYQTSTDIDIATQQILNNNRNSTSASDQIYFIPSVPSQNDVQTQISAFDVQTTAGENVATDTENTNVARDDTTLLQQKELDTTSDSFTTSTGGVQLDLQLDARSDRSGSCDCSQNCAPLRRFPDENFGTSIREIARSLNADAFFEFVGLSDQEIESMLTVDGM
ncbi:uncharacterized protein CDAR_246561 [Caerostris darwini]|uniref:GATA zinc finger domain-containing protein 14-like n=1 Tax=Caerostris darwini TaxID=1538125 RepID=A0AAV4TBU7_9ARAC|nr:uncharacterized protein CDAR_246561 [Caerostris darwini]